MNFISYRQTRDQLLPQHLINIAQQSLQSKTRLVYGNGCCELRRCALIMHDVIVPIKRAIKIRQTPEAALWNSLCDGEDRLWTPASAKV